MMRFLLALLLSLAVSPAFADHVLVKTKVGFYVLDTDAAGNPHLHKIEHIVDLSDDGPQPPPPPGPVLTPRATAIKEAAAKATADPKRDETAAKLAELSRQIAAKITSGDIAGRDAVALVWKTGADMVLIQQGQAADSPAWQPMRDVVRDYYIALAQEGAKDADYAKLFTETASGLDASIVNRQALDLEQIIKMIMLIIDLILKLFPKGMR